MHIALQNIANNARIRHTSTRCLRNVYKNVNRLKSLSQRCPRFLKFLVYVLNVLDISQKIPEENI